VAARADFLGAKGKSPFPGPVAQPAASGQSRRSVSGHKCGHNDPFLIILVDESQAQD